LIPSTILFIAFNAVDIGLQIRLIDGDSCPEFHRWLQLRRSGILVDFRRIQRESLAVPYLGDYNVNLSAFEEKLIISGSNEVPNQMYHRIEDEFLVFLKSVPLSENVEESQIGKEIEKLINFRHPCVTPPIGFVFPTESGSQQELKMIRLYLEGCSLLEVVSVNPIWWTSTVKAKVIAGIVLCLRFAHSLGLVHGHLTKNNILFDSDHCIQIVDFKPIVLEVGKSESEEGTQLVGFSGKGWTPMRDIQAFGLILSELVLGGPLPSEESIPSNIPDFVYTIIRSGLCPISGRITSFNTILDMLKENNFRIDEYVDSAEVSAFVSWVESAEWPDK
jgi:serine/threonine protein kinase